MSADPKFQLHLLGGFGLCDPTPSRAAIVISSKKARALLAYVAMQEPMRVHRERLATLLWPDRIDRQARQNLRKCLASLRQDLAGRADALLAMDGETVAIRDVVTVDARQLRKFSDTDGTVALDDAAALCRGQFLADLAMAGDELCDWVASERARSDTAASMIMSELASRADAAGDGRKALQAAARLIAIDPFREDWQRLSLTMTARHVGRDEALVQARRFIGLLRKELDVEPEAATADLIEHIKAGRFAPVHDPDVSIGGPINHAQPLDPPDDEVTARPRFPTLVNQHGRAAMVSAIVAAIVAILVASLSVTYGPGARLGLLKATSIAAMAGDRSTIPLVVSPLQSATAETAPLARALTQDILASLSRFSGLTVFDGRSPENLRYRSAGDADTSGVRFGTWGSVARQGSSLRLSIGLNDAASQELVWATEVTESDGRLADLEADAPKRIARELQVQATYAAARGVDGTELKSAALNRLIAKALTVQYRGPSPDDAASAASLYEEALRRDPNCSMALIGLAAELVTSGANLLAERKSTLARAERLVNQALQNNPRVERAFYWLGNIYLGRGQRDLALQSFDRALALNPGFIPAEAHAGFALVLSGRTNEGLSRIEKALGASFHDPNQRLWLRFAGIAQLELGNDRQAIDALLQAVSLAPPPPPLRAALASAYALTGQRSESREQFRLMQELADPAALQQLLQTAARQDGRGSSRYLQGLRLAARDAL
jgi:DNA-binding SARP family transcriptional activator/TolB-like protein/Tfp pilus assembly protein PilF